jgi:multicomponent Na+:H+ antiporter subunit D
MGGAMAVFGAGMALLQEDMRRLLSYHIISQVGYMVAGVGIPTTLATAGAFGHVFNHILYKALLFMSIGVVIYRTGVEDITEVGGLWRVMPVTFVSYLLGAAAISGVPGFNGFVSKGIVIAEAHKSMSTFVIGSKSMPLGGEDLLWWLLIVGGVGTFMSFIKLGYYVFFHGPATVDPDDAKLGQSVPMLAVGGLCLLLGLFPGVLFEVLPNTATIAENYTTYTVAHVGEGVALGVAGFVGFFALKGPLSRATWIPDVDRVINPAVYYGGWGLVRAVTESWAAVDRAVVASASAAMRVGSDPQRYAFEGARRLPGVAVAAPEDGPGRLDLRTSVGTGVLLIVATLTVALAVLLL